MKKYLAIATISLISLCSSCSDTDSNNNNTVDTPAEKPSGITVPQNITLNILGIYPHDTSAYTQGLEFHEGKLYEGTGDYELSSLRITDFKTGKLLHKHLMGTAIADKSRIFGEGITIFKNMVYQLTWQSNIVYVYDISNLNKPVKTFNWPNEGWGITHNSTDLIISDGSANIYFVNPEDFRIKKTLQVTDNLGPVNELNELELIEGFVYANVYQSDYILKIDPENGHVTGKISLPGLPQQYFPDQIIADRTDVLNGIAYDSISKRIYFTGKRWPKLFEATINQ